jgi:hypothetical protein
MMKTAVALICFAALSGCMIDDAELPLDEGQTLEPEPLAGPEPEARHCVVQAQAVPDGRGPESVPPPADAPRCFSRFSQAIELATAGRVKLPEDAIAVALDDAVLSTTSSAASYVIGIEYEHADYRGSTFIFTSSYSCAEYSHYLSAMPSGWNDRISSARAFSGCYHSYHYEHIHAGGAVRDCGAACPYIGDALNDRTSSIWWTR